jgi:hypothetical protein
MDFLDEEILSLFRLLHKNKVGYILIGGFAVNLHGYSRATKDLDLWIKESATNRRNLRKVLDELTGLDFEMVERMQFIPGWSTIRLPSGFELDMMTEMSGFTQKEFDQAFNKAQVELIFDVPIRFLNYNDLLLAKQQAGRPRDLLDIEELTRIHGNRRET